jgi:hypothetical protein
MSDSLCGVWVYGWTASKVLDDGTGYKKGTNELLIAQVSNWSQLSGTTAANLKCQPKERAKMIAAMQCSKLVECNGEISSTK